MLGFRVSFITYNEEESPNKPSGGVGWVIILTVGIVGILSSVTQRPITAFSFRLMYCKY